MAPQKKDRRLLAIGDIHGCFDALVRLFDHADITPQDQVVFLGDYVDRGPDSTRVIEFLIARLQAGNTICLRGNHEVMMLEARHSLPVRRAWSAVGGDATWDSYTRRQARGTGGRSLRALAVSREPLAVLRNGPSNFCACFVGCRTGHA